MIPDLILFFGLALVVVVSAVGLLLSRNAVYAALNLLINFTAIAVFYLLLEAPFLAMIQITVYNGAIMVLFLFVIMLLGAERLAPGPAMPYQRPLSILLGVILLFEAAYAMFFRSKLGVSPTPVPAGFGSPEAIGQTLFSSYLLPFEVISILLLAAMVGAIVLTMKTRRRG
ncbi:MAG: NADH-quinone oxidoreductase subunit J [Anaerolineales bacterium]|nr:NADH-quinone oxidoreductase subunit J [Anaerolineales bacterium]